MLDLDAIAGRVDKGLGTQEDLHMMLEELRRCYEAMNQKPEPASPIPASPSSTSAFAGVAALFGHKDTDGEAK